MFKFIIKFLEALKITSFITLLLLILEAKQDQRGLLLALKLGKWHKKENEEKWWIIAPRGGPSRSASFHALR